MTTLLEALRRIESSRDVYPVAPSAPTPAVTPAPIVVHPAAVEAPVEFKLEVTDDIAPPSWAESTSAPTIDLPSMDAPMWIELSGSVATPPQEVAPPTVESTIPTHRPVITEPSSVDIAAELQRNRADESCDAAARAFIQLHPHTCRLVFASCGSVDDAASTVAGLADALKLLGRAPIEVLGPGAFHLRQVSRDARLAGNLDEFVHAPAEFVFSHAELFHNFDGALLVIEQQQTEVAQALDVRRKLEGLGLTVSGVLYVTRHD